MVLVWSGRAGLLVEYEAAVDASEAAPVRGMLRVTAPVQFGRLHVAPVVARFLDAHPAISVELMLHDRNLDLIEEGLDVAVRIGALADSDAADAAGGPGGSDAGGEPGLSGRPWRAAPTVADLAGHQTIFGSTPGGSAGMAVRQRHGGATETAVVGQ